MVVKPRGKVWIEDGGTANLSRVTAHGLSIRGVRSCSGTGRYRWTITVGLGETLTIRRIHDACRRRVGLFDGGDFWYPTL
jgi:hypothetical protein